jgi:hypothetical protein
MDMRTGRTATIIERSELYKRKPDGLLIYASLNIGKKFTDIWAELLTKNAASAALTQPRHEGHGDGDTARFL